MTSANAPSPYRFATFRNKLLAAMMLVIAAITAFVFYLAQRNVEATAERDLRHDFQAELSWLDQVQDLRRAALAERCRILALRPRIHASLEDGALDLLYPSAKDELRDLMESEENRPEQTGAHSLHARFYRFLDERGAVLPPPNRHDVGELDSSAEAQLALKRLSTSQQIGYIRTHASDEAVEEVIAAPIFSSDTGELIAALVVGFKSFELGTKRPNPAMKSGIFVNGKLHLPGLSKSDENGLAAAVKKFVGEKVHGQSSLMVNISGVPHLLFYKELNPGSVFPPAYEVCIYSLADRVGQLSQLRWRITGGGALLLFGGFVLSHFMAARLAVPVEKLAVDSEENRTRRKRAEAQLATTSEQLKRSTRYSADASHQLKSPVTALRAGIEGMLAQEDLKPEMYEELSGLLHQTHRLTSVIDDLLLLSRMDAGHLQIEARAVNLSQLVEEWLDDLSAVPDLPDVKIDKNLPGNLLIVGERRYVSLIVQNLLENAWKYNRHGGSIRVKAHRDNGEIFLRIGNTGPTIPPEAQSHIFERFHRATDGSHVAGHGLGLNLARQLTQLHGGALRLVRSENDWTEFEAEFQTAAATGEHEAR